MALKTDQTKQSKLRNGAGNTASGLSDMIEGFRDVGAVGMWDRTKDAMSRQFDELYSPENLERMFDKAMDGLPEELRDGLKQLFNMLSGALDANAGPSQESQLIGELYGAGGGDSERVRYDSAMEQRDDARFAAGVTIGTGTGAITEVNGIQYVNGKAVNDGNEEDEGAEYMRDMGEQSERQREWEQSQVNVGGIEMSGEEWDRVYETLSDEETRQEIEDDLTEEYGGDRKRAKKAISDALELARLAQKKRDGTYTAEDDRSAQQITANNPDATGLLKRQQAQLSKRDSAPAAEAKAETVAQAAVKSDSVMEGGNLIAARTDFNAERITPVYNMVAKGASVIDPATPAADATKPVELAAAASSPATKSMSANLDKG